MENKPPVDRTTLFPILLGVFSLFGILLVFMIGRYHANRPAVPAPATATPFKYQLIGTEPGISTAETIDPNFTENPAGSPQPGLVVTALQGQISSSNLTSGPSSGTNVARTKTPSSVNQTAVGSGTDPIIVLNPGTKSATPPLVVIERTHTPTRTPGPTITKTPSRTQNSTPTTGQVVTSTPSRTRTSIPTGATQVPLVPGTYDDSHPLIAYDGWSPVTDPSAYQSTIHVSNTAGSTATFSFVGQQIRITFMGGGSLGTIRINIGGLNFDLDQSNGTEEWVSALLTQGTYTVTITHSSGGSVNIDSIIIPDFTTTATPPTPTSTTAPGGVD